MIQIWFWFSSSLSRTDQALDFIGKVHKLILAQYQLIEVAKLRNVSDAPELVPVKVKALQHGTAQDCGKEHMQPLGGEIHFMHSVLLLSWTHRTEKMATRDFDPLELQTFFFFFNDFGIILASMERQMSWLNSTTTNTVWGSNSACVLCRENWSWGSWLGLKMQEQFSSDVDLCPSVTSTDLLSCFEPCKSSRHRCIYPKTGSFLTPAVGCRGRADVRTAAPQITRPAHMQLLTTARGVHWGQGQWVQTLPLSHPPPPDEAVIPCRDAPSPGRLGKEHRHGGVLQRTGHAGRASVMAENLPKQRVFREDRFAGEESISRMGITRY